MAKRELSQPEKREPQSGTALPADDREMAPEDIFEREAVAQLTPEERSLCFWKQLGFSSRDIAREKGISVARVNALCYRIKRKIRKAFR